jgi:hypothetical protein
MLDIIEYRIAARLSEHYLYPYAREIYINIFRNFSHFPIRLKDLGINDQGTTITFLAYVVMVCLDQRRDEFLPFYKNILKKLKSQVKPYFPYNIKVETILGCILYYYHPAEIKSALASVDLDGLFNAKEKYEYELKKNTILIHVF